MYCVCSEIARCISVSMYMTPICDITRCVFFFGFQRPKHVYVKVRSAADAPRGREDECVCCDGDSIVPARKSSRKMMTHCTMIHNLRVALQCGCQQHVKRSLHTQIKLRAGICMYRLLVCQ